MEDIIAKIPLHENKQESDTCNMCVPQANDKDRIAGNVESIATAIMEALDAVDADENTKISSIMIEIGIE